MPEEFIFISQDNIELLKKFISLNTSENFTYYSKRNTDIIKNHVVTVILKNENDIIGYGHLDDEYYIWLGLCVLENYTGKGYGKKIINFLFEQAKINKIKELRLSVYAKNLTAFTLYKKVGFETLYVKNNSYYMVKKFIY